LRLRLQNQSGHAAEAHGLEVNVRRENDHARSLDRELEFSVPIALLDQEQQGRWAEDWSQSRIDANRPHDQWAKEKYFGVDEVRRASATTPATTARESLVEKAVALVMREARPRRWCFCNPYEGVESAL
jgi:hypothetical protein